MLKNLSILKNPVIYLLLFAVYSCEKTTKEENQYYLSSELVKTIEAAESKAFFATLSLISPKVQSVINEAQYNVKVYKMLYQTTFAGNTITASGLICVPDADMAFPLLSIHNGTNTLHSKAPTENVSDPFFSFIESLSSNGYIVLFPDYIGFGASSEFTHPYHHRTSNDASIIDFVRAAAEFLKSDITRARLNDELFLMGYSQGGWATLSVLNTIENSEPLNYNIVAASCGAGAYNLYEFSRNLISQNNYEHPIYLPYYIESHLQNGFLQGNLNQFFNEPYASRIPLLFDGENTASYINSQLTTDIPDLVTQDLRQNFESSPDFEALRNDLKQNSVSAWKTSTPLLFVHGTADTDIPVSQTENIYTSFLQLEIPSSQLRMVLLEGLDHDSAILPWGVETILQFNAMK